MKKSIQTQAMLKAFAGIAVFSALFAIRIAGEKSERMIKKDFNCPTLGVNTLRYNGNLVVTSTDVAARRYGLRVGDIIRSTEGKPMKQISDFVSAIEGKKRGDRICMIVSRDDATMSIRRKFRGEIRGDNGDRQVHDEIKAVGHFAVMKKPTRSRTKRRSNSTRRKANPALSRMQTIPGVD